MKGDFTTIPCALSIAGSDCSCGAGLQADLKTFTKFGVYGLTAVTCVVAEIPGKVDSIQEIQPDILSKQIELLLRALPISTVKTGMLYSSANIEVVLDHLGPGNRDRPVNLVVDPVMVATSGDSLLKDTAVSLYREKLLPIATIATPNMDEARVLTGKPVRNLNDVRSAARELSDRYETAFLVKGGHLDDESATDVLVDAEGLTEFSSARIENVSTHGTGCSYSSAIAAGLANGRSLREAIATAKEFVTESIRCSFRWEGSGDPVQALNHFRHGLPE